MTEKIRVNYLMRGESKEVSLEEAKEILEQTLNDSGLVADAKRNKIIYRMGPEIEEINILEAFIGGG